MINCKQVENYMCEKLRMCKIFECSKCPLNIDDSGYLACNSYEMNNPIEAINIVQDWSNKNPLKTLLTEFLKSYPKTTLNYFGCPNIAPCELGIVKQKDECKDKAVYCSRCKECWNTPVNESGEELNDT